ncbi:MAG: DUF4783 domain-containing protein [Bernardetiaceae bacterium]|jgi:hypothetical protein|nr:DUF4783 domain-containing protein [Bernardetiaceae bacterium]
MNQHLRHIFFFAVLLGLSPLVASAQNDVISQAKLALRAGNSRDLTRNFNNLVELKIDNALQSASSANTNYSKTHAEYVLKDFFKENPPQSFEYIHEGTSKEGMKYTIGRFKVLDKNSKMKTYRVFMKLKLYGDTYLIDHIDFSIEEPDEN